MKFQIFHLIPRCERKKAWFLLLLMFFAAIIETFGITSIMPLLGVLSNKGSESNNVILREIHQFINPKSHFQFVCIVGTLAFSIITLGIVIKSIATYCTLSFCHTQSHKLASFILSGYLNRPYSWFIKQDSSELTKFILSEVDKVIDLYIMPFFKIVSNIMLTICLGLLLIIFDVYLAITIGVFLFSILVLIRVLLYKNLKLMGEQREEANTNRFRYINEVFSGIKSVKVMNYEENYKKNFFTVSELHAKKLADLQILAQLPRYFLEFVSFLVIVISIIYISIDKKDPEESLSLLGLYAFAGYRLLPSIQNIISQASLIRFGRSIVDKMVSELNLINSSDDLSKNEKDYVAKYFLSKKIEINLINVIFNYENEQRNAIKNVSISLEENKSYGIVGQSGAGKTTLIDLIVGLLQPSKGVISYGFKNKTSKISFNYVPQDIFILNKSIIDNVTFGSNLVSLDSERLKYALDVACLSEYVDSLTDGLDTILGDHGIRMSGGQRQRIGIARAIYKKSSVIIFDEATSALDNITESKVMKNLEILRKTEHVIMIFIAHRLTTIKNVDCIFFLKNGSICGEGTFSYLTNNSVDFKEFTKALSL